MAATTVEHVRVGGIRLRVSVREPAGGAPGSGPPLLLINGLGAQLELWEPLRLRLRMRTIAFDAPGTGGSDTTRGPLTVAGLAALAEGMLDVLGAGVVDVLGVSWGGGLAQQLAHRAPTRVRRLILAATSCGLGSLPGRPSALRHMLTPARYHSRAHFERVAADLYGGRTAREPGSSSAHMAARFIRPPSGRGYLWQLLAAGTWSSLPWLRSLPQQTLVIVGDDDPIIPLTNARVLAAAIPDARLEVLDGAGHLFLADEPERSADLVNAFLLAPGR